MLRFLALACGAGIAWAGAASAQAIIIGGGLAKDCYESVEDGSTRYTQIERICTNALTQESLTRTNRAATLVNRGIVRMRAERYEDAIADYDRALALEPELGAAYLNRGAALIFMEEYEQAVASLDRAIDLETQDLHAAYYNRAIARERSGDVEGAYFDFARAGDLMPDWDLPQRQLSRFTVVGPDT